MDYSQQIISHSPPCSPRNGRPSKKVRSEANVIASLNEMGISNYVQQKHDEAEQIYSKALSLIDLRSTGSVECREQQQEDTNAAAQSISGSASLRGTRSSTALEYDEGLSTYSEPLPIELSFTSDDIACTLFYNVAQTYSRKREYATAKQLFQQSLDRSSAIETFPILHNLGHCSYRLGQTNEAMEYYHKALSQVAPTAGGVTKSKEIALTLNCLGVLSFHNTASNEKNTAMDYFQRSLAILRPTLSDNLASNNMRHIATILNNIGRVYYMNEEFNDALNMYEHALNIRRQVLGHNSIDAAATIFNRAQTLYQLGCLDKSLQCYNEFIAIVQSIGSDCNQDIALAFRGIAEVYYEKSQLQKAKLFYVKSLDAQRASLGNIHQDIAATLNKLGNLCYEMQDFQTAMKYYQNGLDIEQRVLDPNHPHLIITLTNMAQIYRSMNQFKHALAAYQKVLDLTKTSSGSNLQVADVLCSIGLMNYHLCDYENAFDSYQEALRVRRELYRTDEHPEIASNLNSLGLVLFKQEMYELAKGCFLESLRIRQLLLGEDHRDCAILFYNLATIHFELGEEDVAIKYYKETLRVERESLGADHEDTVLTLQHLGQVFHNCGHLDEALEYFYEALQIERKRYNEGKDNKMSIGKLLNLIGNVSLQKGDASETMKCYIEASRLFEELNLPGSTLVIAGYNMYGLSKMHPPCAEVA